MKSPYEGTGITLSTLVLALTVIGVAEHYMTPQKPDTEAVLQNMSDSIAECNERRDPLTYIGETDIDSFGGTYDGRVGYFLPASLAGEFRLIDMSQGSVKVVGHVFIDPATHGIIVEVGDLRIGFL